MFSRSSSRSSPSIRRLTPPPARIVRHKDEVATGQGNESGQCRTLVAAFFFFNLNDELGSFGECFFDGRSANINTFFEVRTEISLKGEKNRGVLRRNRRNMLPKTVQYG